MRGQAYGSTVGGGTVLLAGRLQVDCWLCHCDFSLT